MMYNLSLTPEQWQKIAYVLIEQVSTDVICKELVDVMVRPIVSFHGEFNLSLTPLEWSNIVYVLMERSSVNVECFYLVNVMSNFSASFDDDKEG